MARLSLPPLEQMPGGSVVAGLSRRVRTLIVAGVLFLVLFILALTMPVPYVILSPGPTYNTLGTDSRGDAIIGIVGRTPAKRAGHLNLTTVSVSGESVSAFQAFAGWLMHDEVVVPTAAVYPPGETEQKTNRQNAQDFVQSQDSATAAALCELKYPKAFGVISVIPQGPSKGVLEPGDAIVSVAGKPATTATALTGVLRGLVAGSKVPVVVQRRGKQLDLAVTPMAAPKNVKGARLGITVSTTCLAPFTVDLGLGNEIGGPSAGLMFALGIMDKIGSKDLTNGRFIAGTGTIDPAGAVGPIGGIALKMIAARAKGATVFLAPAGNCADVRKSVPSGLQIVRVDTLHHAVAALEALENGQRAPTC